jgi:hypothetical protein
MRVSGAPKDQNYWAKLYKQCPMVTLNGMPMQHVVEADDIRRQLVVEVWENDRPRLGADNMFERKTLYGDVRIIGELLPGIH